MVCKSGRIAEGAALERFWKSAAAAASLNFEPVSLASASPNLALTPASWRQFVPLANDIGVVAVLVGVDVDAFVVVEDLDDLVEDFDDLVDAFDEPPDVPLDEPPQPATRTAAARTESAPTLMVCAPPAFTMN